jgi:peptide/nickel transport system permease protein
VLFFVSIIVFSIMRLIPGDPVTVLLGEGSYDQEVYDILQKELGLDKSLPVQYFYWIQRVVVGDIGKSIISGKPVIMAIAERFPATVYLGFSSVILALVIAIPLGVFAAVRQNTKVDYTAMGFALVGVSIPTFWQGIMLILVFALYLGWLPSMGYASPFENLGLFLTHLTLPALCLASHEAASLTRYTRAEMLEQLRQDYVRTATAKGLPRWSVIYKHTLKNSLIPVVTVVGLQIGRLIGGATVIETIFAWPGVARLVVEAIYARDYPIVQGAVLCLAAGYVIINLIVDIVYKWLDPRIRFA